MSSEKRDEADLIITDWPELEGVAAVSGEIAFQAMDLGSAIIADEHFNELATLEHGTLRLTVHAPGGDFIFRVEGGLYVLEQDPREEGA